MEKEKVEEVKTSNNLGKSSTRAKKRKLSRRETLEMAYQLTKNVYNTKSISWRTKLRHYDTVIKPETLYTGETLVRSKQGIARTIREERS